MAIVASDTASFRWTPLEGFEFQFKVAATGCSRIEIEAHAHAASVKVWLHVGLPATPWLARTEATRLALPRVPAVRHISLGMLPHLAECNAVTIYRRDGRRGAREASEYAVDRLPIATATSSSKPTSGI